MDRIGKLLVFIFLPISSLMAQTGYSIQMDLTGFKDGTVFRLVDLSLDRVIDSATLDQGKVLFSGRVKEPVGARIHTSDNKYLVVYLENKRMTIKGDYADFGYATIEGSEINAYWTRSRDSQRKYQPVRDSLMQKYFLLGNDDSVHARQIVQKIGEIDSSVLQYRLSFIKNEKPTYFTMNELFYIRNDLPRDTLAGLYDRFPESLRNSRDGSVIRVYIKNKKPEVGSYFTDIEGQDPDGNKHKLSELKGKYVLLEFWASWCGPCRQENPLTVSTYAKYRSRGFEVFAFSTDADKTSWTDAISKDHLNWLNVSDLKGPYSISSASYQVRAIPQNFLIDPRGVIIAKNLRGDALAKKLNEIWNVPPPSPGQTLR